MRCIYSLSLINPPQIIYLQTFVNFQWSYIGRQASYFNFRLQMAMSFGLVPPPPPRTGRIHV